MKKRLIAIFIILCIFLGIGAGACFLFYQPAEKMIDETQGDKTEDSKQRDKESDKSSNEGDDSEDYMVLGSQVHTYMGENAEKANEAIQGIEYADTELVLLFSEETEEELAGLGTGELFWLEGSQETPLGDTYIGKVVSNIKTEGTIRLSVKSPTLDEVFDEVHIDEMFELSADNINYISAVDGVELTPVDSIPADFFETAAPKDGGETINLIYDNNVVTQNVNASSKENFAISVDVDLAKLLSTKEKNDSDKDEKKLVSKETECKLTGKLALEDLKLDCVCDWDKKTMDIQEVSMGVSGKQTMAIEWKMKAEGELGGDKTERKIDDFIKVQGLREKVFPVAYIDWAPHQKIGVYVGGDAIKEQTETKYNVTPFSCGIMLYADIYGNISLEFVQKFEYSNHFTNKLVLVKDNQIVNQLEETSDFNQNVSIDLKAAADADVHIGVSALVYLFNINIVDIGLVSVVSEISLNPNRDMSMN